MPDSPSLTAQYKEALGAEWGTYVAVTEINIDGARAFNAGDPVPASHVARGVVDSSQVSKLSAKAAAAVVSEPKG